MLIPHHLTSIKPLWFALNFTSIITISKAIMFRRKFLSLPHQPNMELNLTTVKTSSDGVWEGDNPLSHAFPLLIVQTILVLFITRLLAFFLKPLRQPRVIAEIIVCQFHLFFYLLLLLLLWLHIILMNSFPLLHVREVFCLDHLLLAETNTCSAWCFLHGALPYSNLWQALAFCSFFFS